METQPSESSPPPILKKRSWRKIILLILGGVVLIFLAPVAPFGKTRLYSVPTRSMIPAVELGDQIFTEDLSYLVKKPERGDIVVFETKGIRGIVTPVGVGSQIYFKRLVGLPGEDLRITDGKLYVNDTHVPITNREGEIYYTNPGYAGSCLKSSTDTFKVPAGQYFVLGDNSPNSSDSRYWGCVPAENIKGKVVGRYWPVNRFGAVK